LLLAGVARLDNLQWVVGSRATAVWLRRDLSGVLGFAQEREELVDDLGVEVMAAALAVTLRDGLPERPGGVLRIKVLW
jgi:hypothetical protein